MLLMRNWMINRSKPTLSIEIIACKHNLTRDGDTFLLQIDHRAHNTGNKDTTITGLETHFVDEQNNLQTQTLPLNTKVHAKTSTPPATIQFSFTPPFPYAKNLKVHFILYHTHGREVFVTNSTQSNVQTQP